jgi:hypothetical protein
MLGGVDLEHETSGDLEQGDPAGNVEPVDKTMWGTLDDMQLRNEFMKLESLTYCG